MASPSLPPTRRSFLQAGLSLGALTCLPASAKGPRNKDNSLPESPGLLFDATDLPRIRANVQRPEFAAYWQAQLGADLAADHHFLTSEVDTHNQIRHLARIATMALRSAFVHLLEPASAHRDIALLALQTALRFDHWDWILEDGHLSVGVMRGPSAAFQMMLAAEWLGNDLDAATRGALHQRLADEVGPAAARAVSAELGERPLPAWTMDPASTGITRVNVSQWPRILANTNLQIIATVGLITAASCLPDHPEAEAWSELALRSIKKFAAIQPTDGTFPEGAAYWGFTYQYYCICLDVLQRRRGVDLRNISDFPAMARYVASVAMPLPDQPLDTVSIGDCNRTSTVMPLTWIASTFRDTTAQELALRPGLLDDSPHNYLSAIWFDASVPARLAADLPHDRIVSPGIVVSRSGWGEEDSVLSLRSGDPVNHEHADRNSLLFAAYGERLLNDPLKASYNPSAPGWLLRQTAAHSAVLIGGHGHQYHKGEEGTNASHAHATLLAHEIGLGWMHATSDATDAYARNDLPVERVLRSIVFLKPDLLVCLDAVDLTEPQDIELRFQAYNRDGAARLAVDADTFRIERPRAQLHSQFHATGPAELSTDQLDLPTEDGIYPYVRLRADDALHHRILTLHQAAPTGTNPPALRIRHHDNKWEITGTHHGEPLHLTLTEVSGDTVPRINLIAPLTSYLPTGEH